MDGFPAAANSETAPGAGAADNQVRRREGRGHIGQKRDDLPLDARLRESIPQFFEAVLSGLMDHPYGHACRPEQRPTLARRAVQRTRALAAAGDQQIEFLAARLRRKVEELFAHRQPRDLGPAAPESSEAVSGKVISARETSRPITRLVNPGTAFGSITTTGTRRSSAAATGGPATYPPMLKTAAG